MDNIPINGLSTCNVIFKPVCSVCGKMLDGLKVYKFSLACNKTSENGLFIYNRTFISCFNPWVMAKESNVKVGDKCG